VPIYNIEIIGKGAHLNFATAVILRRYATGFITPKLATILIKTLAQYSTNLAC